MQLFTASRILFGHFGALSQEFSWRKYDRVGNWGIWGSCWSIFECVVMFPSQCAPNVVVHYNLFRRWVIFYARSIPRFCELLFFVSFMWWHLLSVVVASLFLVVDWLYCWSLVYIPFSGCSIGCRLWVVWDECYKQYWCYIPFHGWLPSVSFAGLLFYIGRSFLRIY